MSRINKSRERYGIKSPSALARAIPVTVVPEWFVRICPRDVGRYLALAYRVHKGHVCFTIGVRSVTR